MTKLHRAWSDELVRAAAEDCQQKIAARSAGCCSRGCSKLIRSSHNGLRIPIKYQQLNNIDTYSERMEQNQLVIQHTREVRGRNSNMYR